MCDNCVNPRVALVKLVLADGRQLRRYLCRDCWDKSLFKQAFGGVEPHEKKGRR